MEDQGQEQDRSTPEEVLRKTAELNEQILDRLVRIAERSGRTLDHAKFRAMAATPGLENTVYFHSQVLLALVGTFDALVALGLRQPTDADSQ